MPDDPKSALARAEAILAQARRDALRRARQAAREANVASRALGLPVAVVYLRDEAVSVTASASAG